MKRIAKMFMIQIMLRGKASILPYILGLLIGLAAPLAIASEWHDYYVEDGEIYIAEIANDSEDYFGQACYASEGSCTYLTIINLTCKSGSKYPILINTDKTATTTQLVCTDGEMFAFTDFDLIDKIVRDSSRIGIVIGMENDRFQASRFSLKGANKTIDHMRTKANEHITSGIKPVPKPAEHRL